MKIQAWVGVLAVVLIALGAGLFLLPNKSSAPPDVGVAGTVKVGETTKGLLTDITVLELLEDSRCPVDVQCIQAGTVRVLASVGSDASLTYTFVLGKPAVAGSVIVTLTEVSPQKYANVTLNPPAYLFTFSTTAMQPAAEGDGTLSGTMTIGPICPVERPDQPCLPTPEMYAMHLVSIYKSDKRTFVKNMKPDAQGNFSTNLPAGVYWVDVAHEAIGGVVGVPAAIKINAGEISTVAIAIDTGIR